MQSENSALCFPPFPASTYSTPIHFPCCLSHPFPSSQPLLPPPCFLWKGFPGKAQGASRGLVFLRTVAANMVYSRPETVSDMYVNVQVAAKRERDGGAVEGRWGKSQSTKGGVCKNAKRWFTRQAVKVRPGGGEAEAGAGSTVLFLPPLPPPQPWVGPTPTHLALFCSERSVCDDRTLKRAVASEGCSLSAWTAFQCYGYRCREQTHAREQTQARFRSALGQKSAVANHWAVDWCRTSSCWILGTCWLFRPSQRDCFLFACRRRHSEF